MLGAKPLEAVLGSGIDNTDHDAVRGFIRAAADLGLSLLFIYPNSKVPADMRTPVARNKDDKAAQEAAKEAGRRDWSSVRSPAGLALATSDKPTLDRYLKRYIELFSTWHDTNGEVVPYNKKRADADEIFMFAPVAVNLAIEVGGSGLVVIDCDTRAQMARWFEANEIDDPADWPAPTVITPGHMGPDADPDDPATWSHSDGGHFYFTVPDTLMPVLPRHLGAMTWGGDDGFAVLWDRRYVLIPPSTRPEGSYEQLGHVYELPEWLADEIIKAGERRVVRARDNARPAEPGSLGELVDAWAANVSWASILEPMGWVPAPRADACGCAVWTAPGEHASPKSATAHDTGCSLGRYTDVNAPLHLWTDHDAPPFTDGMGTDGWTPTFSKLQAVALVSFKGNIGTAMDELGIMPDLAVSVDPDINPKAGVEDTHDTNGDFALPESEVAVRDQQQANEGIEADNAVPSNHLSGSAMDVNTGDTPPPPDAPCPVCGHVDCRCNDDGQFCTVCQTGAGVFAEDPDDGVLWHAKDADDAADTGGHRADGVVTDPRTSDPVPSKSADELLAEMPADFGKATKADPPPADASPYPDHVEDPDPDVFDSKHAGVPRIAPFSHWRHMPPPEYVIEGLIEHGGLSCIVGPPGMGKSTVVLDMACHIATGKSWQGRRTLKTRVLYLPGEGLSGAVQRLRAWEDAHQMDLGDDLLLGDSIILVKAENEAWGEIAAYIARQGIGVVIFDTFARMSSGLEENSATDVGIAVRRFDKLKELTNAGVCVVHHTGKHSPEVARGSSALNGALDSELLIRQATWDTTDITDEDGRMEGKAIEVWTTKQKNSEQLDDPIPLRMLNWPGNDINAPIITGVNGDVDPMQGDIVLARALPEPIVETAIRIRHHVDGLTQQGATRTDLVAAIRPDAYANSRSDTAAYWKQRINTAVDRALRYGLIVTLTGTPSGSRYIPDPTVTPDMARAAAAAEITDAD
ncbi:DNA primase/helicase [Mycobacterium phage Funsized]|nr:DNA primase/helicase [Mycobacterium phage Funsized]